MAIDQFPLFRLATLLARQLSSPIATRIKTYATTHPRMRQQVIARAGRVFRAAELRFKLWTLRLPQPSRAPALADAEAVQVGADIIGEMIIFALGAAIVIFEVNRQADKQEMKVLDERSQWVALLVALQELQTELVLQQKEIDQLNDYLQRIARGDDVSQRSPINPTTSSSSPPDPSTQSSSPPPAPAAPSPAPVEPPVTSSYSKTRTRRVC